MLGDLDDKLRQVNRLDILESVADKVVKYFAALPATDLTADALAQRTRAQLKLGAVRRDQGRIDEALETFKGALATSEDLLRRDPTNIEYQTIDAESLSWIGFVDWSQGRLDQALARFSAASGVLLNVSQRRPDDADLMDRIGAVRTNIGRIYEARGQIEEARGEYAKVLEGYTYLSRREPDALAWRTELGYAHNNLAQLASKDGRLEDAVREYIADRDIKVHLFELDPTNNSRREDLVASEAFLGRVLYLCGQTDAAAVHLRAAMDGIEALLEIDPNSTDWVEKAGNYGWMLGQVSRVRGNAADAERRDKTAVAHLDYLVGKDPGNVGWQRKLALAQLENARRLLGLKETGAAEQAAVAANAAIARALKSAADDNANQLAGAQAELVLGDILNAKGDATNALAAWTRARDSIGEQASKSKDPSMRDAWLSARLRLGTEADGVASAQALVMNGYRDPDFVALLDKQGIPALDEGTATKRIAEMTSKSAASEKRPE